MLWIAWTSPNSHNLGAKSGIGASQTLTPPAPQKHIVVTILGPIFQSQPSPTIHHTYDDRLEGLRCYEMAESV